MRATCADAPTTSGRVTRLPYSRALARRTRAPAPRARPGEDDAESQRVFFSRVDFDGVSPESRAATAPCNLLTMAAVRVVIDQMWGTRHRSPMAPKLIDHLQADPLRGDASAWLARLMAHEELDYRAVALRIIETRKVLAEDPELGFDFLWMREETIEGVANDNLELSRALLACSLDASEDDA